MKSFEDTKKAIRGCNKQKKDHDENNNDKRTMIY